MSSCIILLIILGFGNPDDSQDAVIASIAKNQIIVEGGNFDYEDILQVAAIGPTSKGELRSFLLSKFELTQKEWKAVMGDDNKQFNNPDNENNPVEMVTWGEVEGFITKLNQLTGLNYRLPTSTEWVYAAKGGNKTKNYKYSGSNSPAHDAMWHGGNVPSVNFETKKYTMPVGTKEPNELGLYDMSGNVEEWVDHCVGDFYKGSTFFADGKELMISGNCDVRIARGGHANDWIYQCKVVSWRQYPITKRKPTLGFRLARDIK